MEWIIYVGAFLVSATIIAFSYVVFMNSIVVRLTGKIVSDSKQSNFISIPIYIIWIILIIGGPLYILKTIGLNPPLSQNEILVENIDNQNKVLSLNEEIEKINSALSNIDNLTLNQIQRELTRTRDFVDKMKEEVELQNKMIIDLKLQTKKFKTEAEKASIIANEIKSLNQDQLNAVKFLLTEDANEKNQRSFWIGAIISFPIGVLASIFGNYLWGYRRRKK